MLLMYFMILKLCESRHLNICEELNPRNFKEYENNVVCFNSTDSTIYNVTILPNSKIFVQAELDDEADKLRICEPSSDPSLPDWSWDCQSVIFIVPRTKQLNTVIEHNRVRRQLSTPELLQPRLKTKNVTFSVMTVAGVDWVCEQLSETQCKPLYPKDLKTGEKEPKAEFLTDDRINDNVGVVNDDARWQWSQGRSSSRNRPGPRNTNRNAQDDVFKAFQNDLNKNDDNLNSTGQYVYNINGITWLCRQYDQLQCYPIHNPWDSASTPPPGLSTAVPPHIHQEDVDPGYPEYPSSQGRSLSRVQEENNWEYQDIGNVRTTEKPAFKRTTFCSRSIKFIAKDEAVLSFNTYSGTMKMYISAVRKNRRVQVSSRMLRQNEEGLGGQSNNPHVIINAEVNCDTISLTVEDAVYKIDYGFGRLGVRDLEVLGNLESTGMVPRLKKEKTKLGSVRNFMEPDDFSAILLRPSPLDFQVGNNVDTSDDLTDYSDDDNDDNDDIPVTEDSYQIEGKGDVEVSLGEKSNLQHRYQISKGQDGEVNIDVVVGDQPADDESVVIDNKDYNYTLIISGQNIQVIHHDTNRNITYRHGIDESKIAGVGVLGDLRGTSTSFKEPDEPTESPESPRSFPSSSSPTKPGKTVSVYGELCLNTCELNTDKRHYCTVYGGDIQQCGPQPNTTPQGDTCSSDCRKRDDGYFWCLRDDAPWDYCSPPLVFQQHLNCPPDATRTTVADPSSCARFLSCEAGRVKLEECPDGLHYIQKNRTCEWPMEGGSCADVFGRSYASTPSTTSTESLPSHTSPSPPDRSPILTLARTDPISRVPDDYLYEDADTDTSTSRRIVFPTENINIIKTTITPLLTTTSNKESITNLTLSRSLFTDDGSINSIDTFQGTRPTTSTTTTTTVSPEMNIAEIIERSKDFKYGLTSHGELCTDECAKRGYPYYWCHKPSSSLGQWWDSDFCSPSTTSTHYGKQCEDECLQRGEKYFWCRRQEDGGWGYCSPKTVFTQDSCDTDNKQFYAIVGDCDRYIQCRGNQPIVMSCDGLHFDYILRSCTFEKDARCIGKVNPLK